WTKNIDLDKPTDVIYLDFAKAFDRVPKCRLLYRLKHIGISGNLLNWIKDFLSNRTFRVKIGQALSYNVRVLSGVPQGSVFGPLLFIVYVADLKHILSSPFAMYADDIKLYNACDSYQVLMHDLITVRKWCLDWILPLNLAKCITLHIGNRNPRHKYFIDNCELCESDPCSDLEVTVTSNLSWSAHVLHVTRRANSILFLVSKVFSKRRVETVVKLYKTYIRPILEFAGGVWAPVLQRDVDLLEALQRRATRLPFGRIRPSYEERL
ncbi:RVT 1 domain containing protein, partial [Asbolus verrucosus]